MPSSFQGSFVSSGNYAYLDKDNYPSGQGLDSQSLAYYLHALKQYHLTEPLYRQEYAQLTALLDVEYLQQISDYYTGDNLLTHLNKVLALVTVLEQTYAEFNEQITLVRADTDLSEHLYTLIELGQTLEDEFFEFHNRFVRVYAHYLVCTALCCLHLKYEEDLQTTLESIQGFPAVRSEALRYLYAIMASQPEQRFDAFRLRSILSL